MKKNEVKSAQRLRGKTPQRPGKRSPKTPPRSLDTYTQHQRDIASILDWIQLEIERHADEKLAWGTVEQLGRIKQQLKRVLIFFSGVSDADIERNLEELRM